LFAALGPHMQKYLWWKKYLTALQMVFSKLSSIRVGNLLTKSQLQVQFILIMLHAFQLLFVDCNYPKAFVWWIGMHAVMFFFLFKEFYKQSYESKSVSYHRNQR